MVLEDLEGLGGLHDAKDPDWEELFSVICWRPLIEMVSFPSVGLLKTFSPPAFTEFVY